MDRAIADGRIGERFDHPQLPAIPQHRLQLRSHIVRPPIQVRGVSPHRIVHAQRSVAEPMS
ncbi:MAG TPA: hypothetical protein VIX73_36215 [Kofleriaceae bacterium]|jgi:hypothetical protein